MTNDSSLGQQDTPAEKPGAPSTPAAPDGHVRVVDRRWWARADHGEADSDEGPPSTKPTYVQELEQRLAQKDEELRATIARYREAAGEFDEARARFRREVGREVERGKRAILADLLDVIDNLDRAVEAARQDGASTALLAGVDLVRSQFLGKLDSLGVRRLEVEGMAFDPALHEAVTTVPITDPARDGLVVGVVRHGYMIGTEVLRPAVVAVARLEAEGAGT
ncbi:MAG: nucleotide exchange factor GrpE [Acidobacteriota bacterium]